MRYIKDFFYVQKRTFKNMLSSMKYLPVLVVMLIASQLIMNVLYGIIRTLNISGYLSSLIIYLVEIFIISFLLNALYTIIKSSNLFINFIRDDSNQFVLKIIQIGFIFYLGQMILNIFILNPVVVRGINILSLILLILFSALPETIYLEDYNAGNTVQYAIKFLYNNIYNWLIPNLIFYILIYKLGYLTIFPFDIKVTYSANNILSLLMYLILVSFIFLYRGHLFQILSNSNIRKREFQNKF